MTDLKRNQIVADEQGNHFRMVSPGPHVSTVESVATKELFTIYTAELRATDREAM